MLKTHQLNNPKNSLLESDLAEILMRLADVQMTTGDLAKAERTSRETITLLTPLAQKSPNHVRVLRDLGRALERLSGGIENPMVR